MKSNTPMTGSKVLRLAWALVLLTVPMAPMAVAQMQPTNALNEKQTPAALLTAAYNEAMNVFQSGDYAAAASQFESIITKAGTDAQIESVYFTLGASYYNLQQYAKAVETLKNYQEKYPGGARIADSIFYLGLASLTIKKHDEAVAQFAKLMTVPQFREQALYYEGVALKEARRQDEAIKTLETLISPDIHSAFGVKGAMILAGLYGEKKQPEKANSIIGKVLQKTEFVENLAQLNSMAVELGDDHLQAGGHAEAIACYRMARTREQIIQFQEERVTALEKKCRQMLSDMHSNSKDSLQYLPALSELRGDIAEAKQMSEDAKKMPEFMAGILLRMGKCWYEWNRKWESIVVFNRVLQKYPGAKEREPAIFAKIVAYAELNLSERCQQICADYLKEFPKGEHASTVGYLSAATALQAGDARGATTLFGTMLERQPDSEYAERMRFLMGNAEFMQGNYDDALSDYRTYLGKYPAGAYSEEAEYRSALAMVFAGSYEEALAALNAFLQKHPNGEFVADAKYRIMVCKYAAQLYDEVIAETNAWRTAYANNAIEGEVLGLLGDALAARGDTTGAIPVYIESYKKAKTDEVLNYSLFEAGKLMQKLGRWKDVWQLFEEFVHNNPDHPSVVAAMFWIGKSLAREGREQEAKKFLVEQLKHYMNDPGKEAVEQLLQQLAQLCAKRPRPPATPLAPVAVSTASPSPVPSPTVTPAPLPPHDAVAELNKQLEPLRADANATAQARILYASAELAALRKKKDEHDKAIAGVAARFKPEELSPLLLAQAGDCLLAKGESDRAAMFYSELKDCYPRSSYLDFAYVGLGEIAFGKKDYQTALQLFTDGADNFAGSKVKEATIGKAKTLLATGKYEDARKLYDQIATVREWRGESTAYAVYSLGQIEEQQSHWAEAIAYYQRVFVLYQRYLPWVAKAYVSSAECFEKQGKRQEAVDHLKEMLRNEKLQNFPEIQKARQMLEKWGVAA